MVPLSSNRYTIFLHISNVDFGDFPTNSRESYVAYAGSKKNVMSHPHNFNRSNKNRSTYYWTFNVTNIEKAYIRFTIFKKRLFASKEIVGDLYLRLVHFEPNTVVSHSFDLKTEHNYHVPPSVCLDIHIDNIGVAPFYAPPGMIYHDYALSSSRSDN